MPATLSTIVDNQHRYMHELRRPDDLRGMPLASEDITDSLGEIIDEVYTNAMLADRIGQAHEALRIRVRPKFADQPLVESLRIELFGDGDDAPLYSQKVKTGPWHRSAQRKVLQLREEGTLDEDETAVEVLTARGCSACEIAVPMLQLPPVREATLDECGVRELGGGALAPDRPVLINSRLVTEAVEKCEEADVLETGGAAFGHIVRLPAPLPGTETRVVTILAGMVFDERHTGEVTRYHFSPQALSDAQQMCEMRGLDEQVQTVVHTHGWSGKCGNCNQNAGCLLPEATPSLQDYVLLATLFPSKATLMPIVGRKLGIEGRRPAMQVFAWRKGEMRPIRWRQYLD